MAPTEIIRGERYELIRGKHYEVDIEYDEEYVTIAIAPIWDSARRHTLDMVIRRDRLREELDERLQDLFRVLTETKKVIEKKLGSPAIDRSQSISIDTDKSGSSAIDSDEER
jgi:hypothetical protein